jgi:hypothetical protein
LSLLLGREGSVFLDAWCGRTRLRIGGQEISGGRCERGGYGNVCKAWMCICDNFLWEFSPPLPLFFWFLSQNGVFCSHFSLH